MVMLTCKFGSVLFQGIAACLIYLPTSLYPCSVVRKRWFCAGCCRRAQGTLRALGKGRRGDVWKSQIFFLPLFPLSACPGKFTCNTGRCIERSMRCDGWLDCVDGSDERSCSKSVLYFGWIWDHSQCGSCGVLLIQPLPVGSPSLSSPSQLERWFSYLNLKAPVGLAELDAVELFCYQTK